REQDLIEETAATVADQARAGENRRQAADSHPGGRQENLGAFIAKQRARLAHGDQQNEQPGEEPAGPRDAADVAFAIVDAGPATALPERVADLASQPLLVGRDDRMALQCRAGAAKGLHIEFAKPAERIEAADAKGQRPWFTADVPHRTPD